MHEDSHLDTSWEDRHEPIYPIPEEQLPCTNCGRYAPLITSGSFCSNRCAREYQRETAVLVKPQPLIQRDGRIEI